jgi:hypothetical protein
MRDDGTVWTGVHESWPRTLSFDRLGVQLAFDEAHGTVLTTHARRARLGCLRGVSTLTALGLTTEIGDWCRFTGASIGT